MKAPRWVLAGMVMVGLSAHAEEKKLPKKTVIEFELHQLDLPGTIIRIHVDSKAAKGPKAFATHSGLPDFAKIPLKEELGVILDEILVREDVLSKWEKNQFDPKTCTGSLRLSVSADDKTGEWKLCPDLPAHGHKEERAKSWISFIDEALRARVRSEHPKYVK